MHVVHTPGLPPNQGRMNLLITGWTWKSRKALSSERMHNCSVIKEREEALELMDSKVEASRVRRSLGSRNERFRAERAEIDKEGPAARTSLSGSACFPDVDHVG
jgi:hypothetical protein